MSAPKAWEGYEQVAAHLLGQFAEALGINHVEGKQVIPGHSSGTSWEVDGKGVRTGPGEGFVIVECRRYTTSKQTQEKIAAFAYLIQDTGAVGGIIVTPLGLQVGAEKVARAENIIDVHLRADSTPYEYFLSFLNRVFVGLTDRATLTDHVSVEVVRGDAG